MGTIGSDRVTPVDAYILVVEDDRDVHEALVDLLGEYGYRTRSASNGKMALDILRSEPPPSLILLDQMMPHMNGEEFIVELGAMLPEARPPVCMLTADPRFAREEDVVAVIRKPFDETVVMTLVERYCPRMG